MKVNALAVANYFIELADKDKIEIKLLGLMKRVYIAHGFSLALYHKSLLDDRFDAVEAWKYGPVIPSVYHSFKHLKGDPITMENRAVVLEGLDYSDFEIADLKDEDARKIVETVWGRYKNFSDMGLVYLTHQKGTPWDAVYEKDMNHKIPDEYTQLFYTKLIEKLLNKKLS